MGTIGFYVAPGFQMLDLAGPAGAFEAANDRLESPAYRLHVLAADKGAVTSSLGVAITGASLDDAVLDTLVVTGGRIEGDTAWVDFTGQSLGSAVVGTVELFRRLSRRTPKGQDSA